MWFLLLILSFTSAENADLVDPDDNIAMESQPQAQALYYRAKYQRPDYYYRGAEEEDNHDYDSDDYHSNTKSSLRHKKYYPHSDKENIYINKNNYASRAREPRDESWRPINSQNEEDGRIVKHYHYDNHPKPQKIVAYYNDVGSKKGKKYEEPRDEHEHHEHHHQIPQRPKQQPKQAASNNYEKPSDQYHSETNSIHSPSTFLQQIEEETKSGKMLGFASLVEHFSAEDDEEELKAALKEGSLDDIKKTVPKSGMVFKIFQDDHKEPMRLEEFPSNSLDETEFKPSASTYYAKPSQYRDEPQPKPTLPNRLPLQTEKKKMKKIRIPQVPPPPTKPAPQNDYDDEDMKYNDPEPVQEVQEPEMDHDRPMPKPMQMTQERPRPKPVQMERPHRPQPPEMEEERPKRPQPPQMEKERPQRPQMEKERPQRPQMEKERPQRPQPPQMEKERPQRPQPPQMQKERPRPQPPKVEQERPERPKRPQPTQKPTERPRRPKTTQSTQDHPHDSRPNHSEASRYAGILQETRSYPQIEAASKQRYRPIHLALNDNDDYNYYHQPSNNRPVKSAHRYQEGQESQQLFQTSNPDGYGNHNWASSGTSETEISTLGSHLETSVVHSSPVKAPESAKFYYDHFKSQSSNPRPEEFDHTKALKGSISFNAANIVGNHNYGDVESTRTPIQFVSESEATPKYKVPHNNNKHLKQHVQKYAETLFKNMYKIKEEDEEESPNKIPSHRHQYTNQDLAPRPAALVSVKLPHFEAETPMMTEDEFQYKFGHLPVVTTPKSYYFTTISTPLKEVIELKPSKPQAEGLTQYWSVPDRDFYKNKIPSTDNYSQQSKFVPTKFQLATNQQSYKNPSTRYNELSGEASNNNYKNTKGQIERPSTNWKDGQIYLTKEYKGKISDLYIKTSDKENYQHSAALTNERPSRPKKIIINADLVPHVHDPHSPKKSKYDISLLPSYRLQKRGDKTEDSSKNVSLVSETNRKRNVQFPPLETGFKPMYQSGHVEPERKSPQKQGDVILGSDNRNNREFSVSASYQIDRSSKSVNGEK